MLRLRALAFAAAPLALAAAAPAALQRPGRAGRPRPGPGASARGRHDDRGLHPDRPPRPHRCRGTLTIKRPGRIRFDYGRSANMLIVGDGRALTFIDYDVGQRQRWPINNSPLSVLLNPNQDLARFARVVQNDAQVLMIEARDPRRREFGTITIAFAKVAGRARRADAAGLEHARRAEQPDDRAAVRPALQRAGRRQRLHLSQPDAARPARLNVGGDSFIWATGRHVLNPRLQLRCPLRVFPLLPGPGHAIDLA